MYLHTLKNSPCCACQIFSHCSSLYLGTVAHCLMNKRQRKKKKILSERGQRASSKQEKEKQKEKEKEKEKEKGKDQQHQHRFGHQPMSERPCLGQARDLVAHRALPVSNSVPSLPTKFQRPTLFSVFVFAKSIFCVPRPCVSAFCLCQIISKTRPTHTVLCAPIRSNTRQQ